MNRGTVIFLTLVVLLTHTLAIYQTPDGEFAAPCEPAHVAYRLGRNLVHSGAAQWDPATQPQASYPSLIWIGVGAFASRLSIPPTLFAQYVGLASALITVVLLAQFSATRTAGLIAPLLLAASGSVAAAAGNGTETPLVMLLVTAAFLAFERGWRRPLVVTLIALSLTASEGLLFAAALGVIELVDRPGDRQRRASLRRAFLQAGVWVPLVLLLRHALTGSYLSPFEKLLLRFDGEQITVGAHYLWSFARSSGLALVLLLPLLALVRGHLTPRARRSGALFVVWSLGCLLTGGDRLPFWNALTPALPLLFISIQESLTHWMDEQPKLSVPVWSGLVATLAACFLASKLPGDLGPIPLENVLQKWAEPSPALKHAFNHKLSRSGLLEEIRKVEALRPIGVFLKDEVREDARILTFWPGAIGYLSRKEVIDVLGRATPPPGQGETRSWRGVPKVDLLASMQSKAHYVVPMVGTLAIGGAPTDFLRSWLRRWDIVGENEDRLRNLIGALRGYELIAVPVAEDDSRPEIPAELPFLLLRSRAMELGPRLELTFQNALDGDARGRGFGIEIRHKGHRQVVDLYIVAADREERVWTMRPTGEWVPGTSVACRTNLLMHKTGSHSIHAAEGTYPPGTRFLNASLHNPGIPPGEAFSSVGVPVRERVPTGR